MKKLLTKFKTQFSKKAPKKLKDERGQGMLEYILLVVVVVGLVFMFKGSLKTKAEEMKSSLEGAIGNVLSN